MGDWEALCGQLVDDGLVGDLLLEDRGGPLSALVKQLPSDVDHPAAHLARACLALSQGVSGDQRCARELHLVGERLDGSGADPALLVSIAATHALRACLHGSDVEANHAADAKLSDARELSSHERNRLIALPYKLMLPMLARRIAYAALRVNDPDFALAANCERQSLPQFFGAARTR